MLVKITGLTVLDAYRLGLSFSDGTSGEVDLENELWGEVFEPLRDKETFRLVRLDPELGTVVWPNGADFDPEGLRALAQASPQGMHSTPGSAAGRPA